jgi:hypothetical protein
MAPRPISRMILYLPSSVWPTVKPAEGPGVPVSLPVTGQRLASGGWLPPQCVQATQPEYQQPRDLSVRLMPGVIRRKQALKSHHLMWWISTTIGWLAEPGSVVPTT